MIHGMYRKAKSSSPLLAPVFFLINVVVAVGCVTTVATPTPVIEATVSAAVEAALPTPTLIPTPDIKATVEARMRAMIAAIPTPTPTPTLGPTSTPTPTPTPSLSLAAMVELVRPGVVRIETDQGIGSGVIFESDAINRSALVLTNFHVIEDASWVEVLVNDSTTYSGTVRGVDSVRDLAVVSICCARFSALQFGDAESLEVGNEAIAIGYALGIPGGATVTRGIVSAIRYDSSRRRLVIQIDAPINPGNSGGPLFSLDGEVVGINTFKLESAGGGRPTEGLGFAVSEVTVQALLPELKRGTYALNPTPTPVTSASSEGFNLPAMLPTLADLPEGATIESEGFEEGSDTTISYERNFEGTDLVMELGSSRAVFIGTLATLYANASDAESQVLDFRGLYLDPESVAEFARAFAEGAGFTPDGITAEPLDFPRIGDTSGGVLIKIETGIGDFDFYMLFLARGRVATLVGVVGAADRVALEDVIPLAQLIDKRIQENSPSPKGTPSPAPTPTPTPEPPSILGDIVVDSTSGDVTAGDGNCTLREAINNANSESDTTMGDCASGGGRDVIALEVLGIYILTEVDGTSGGPHGLPFISSEIIINGNGSTIQRDGNAPNFRIFQVLRGGNLTLNDLTVSRGDSLGNGGAILNLGTLKLSNVSISVNRGAEGGGIFNVGTVTIEDSVISRNVATGEDGGGIRNASGHVTITNSTINGNRSTDDGGAIHNRGEASLTIRDSTISNNTAAGDDGGAIHSTTGSTLVIENSTISHNSAASDGGGINNQSGSTLTLVNSTVSGNTAADLGGGIKNPTGLPEGAGNVTIINSTIANNSAKDGGGVFGGNRVEIMNTILANNSGGDCSSSISSNGYNLDSDDTCGLSRPEDLRNREPMLGQLQDNGGPTATHALLPGSPAIDAGYNGVYFLKVDQRGTARPQGGRIDIGAFERE